jgi:ADP-ribose pyrophosphatase YjhB (NUDIX family)
MTAPASSLTRYPRPNVAVDVAVLTIDPAERRLCVLVQQRERPVGEALPGRFLRAQQTVPEAVAQALDLKVGIELPPGRAPHLLRIFDSPDRDDRAWTISAAHSLSLPVAALSGAVGRLVPIARDGRLPEGEHLLFDHDEIVAVAVAELRQRYDVRELFSAAPDPDRFVADPFTLSDLRHAHEAVLGERLQKDNFNRRVIDRLVALKDGAEPARRREGRGRPATLYRHARA